MKLSVMVITYNHEHFLAQALESVLAQRTNFEFEIVVGEDYSTDGTREVLSDFHRRYPQRIVGLVRDRNVGVMKNLKETLAACRGQYVAFLEGDDFWTCDDKLQSQADFLDAHPECAISCHRARFLDEIGTAEHTIFPAIPAGTYALDELLKGNFIMTCTAVCRWNCFGQLPNWFLDLNLGDWPLFALLARNGTVNLMDDTMATYRVHQGGIWSSRTQSSRLKEGIRMLKALNGELSYEHSKIAQATIARHYLQWAALAQLDDKRAETAKCLVNCLRFGGASLQGTMPVIRRLGWYALLGSWYEPMSKAKRSMLG